MSKRRGGGEGIELCCDKHPIMDTPKIGQPPFMLRSKPRKDKARNIRLAGHVFPYHA